MAAVQTGSPVPGHSILRSYPIFSPPPDYGRATRSRLDQKLTRNSRTEASSVGWGGTGRGGAFKAPLFLGELYSLETPFFHLQVHRPSIGMNQIYMLVSGAVDALTQRAVITY